MLAGLACADRGGAQQTSALTVEPNNARQATTLVLGADASLLSQAGRGARSLGMVLPRGMRVDRTSRDQLCSRREALRAACPDASRIGFGRFGVAVRGYDAGSGETELAWAIDAYLGAPRRHGDPASVVLLGKLLGADLVSALLTPSLGTTVPSTTTTIGRIAHHGSAFEIRFDALPAQLAVAPPISATPSSLSLSLGAAREVRQNFVRRFKIRTPSGYEVRKVRDHRLIGHYLFRTPSRCRGAWPAELRVGFGAEVKRFSAPIPCTNAVSLASTRP